ncbi:MAG: hypothetical protein ACTSRZ_04600 [Promethearchaeota archaeon]
MNYSIDNPSSMFEVYNNKTLIKADENVAFYFIEDKILKTIKQIRDILNTKNIFIENLNLSNIGEEKE